MPSKELTTVASKTSEDGAIQVEVTLPVRPRRQESRNGGKPDSVDGGGKPVANSSNHSTYGPRHQVPGYG